MPSPVDTIGLKAVWHLMNDDVEHDQHGADDADARGRRFGVAKRNVLGLINYEHSRGNTSVDGLFAVVEDVTMNCEVEVDGRFYAASWDSAFAAAKASVIADDEVLFEDFMERLSSNTSSK